MSTSNDKAKLAISQRIKFGLARGTNKVLRKDKDSDIDSIQQLTRDEKHFSDEKKRVKTLAVEFDRYCLKLSACKKTALALEAAIANTTFLDEDMKSEMYDETVDIMRKSGDCCLSDAKKIVNETLDKIKKAKSAHQDLLTAKKSYEKCKEQKIEKAKNMVATLEKDYETLVGQLNDEIPETREKLKNHLDEFAVYYIKWKKDYLEKEIKATDEFSSKKKFKLSNSISSSDYTNASFQKYSNFAEGSTKDEPATACLAKLAESNSASEGGTPTTNLTNSSDSSPRTTGVVNGKVDQGMHSSIDLSKLTPPFKVIALYEYSPDEPDELACRINDELEVLKWCNGEEEPGWLNGKNLRTGATGIFPVNYVKKV